MYNDDDYSVVDEIPVYLSRDLEEKLFIFQYPVHPETASSSKLNIVKSQIKPDNQEVVLEIGLDTESPNYDRSHGEQIALSIDKDKTCSANKTFPSKYVDRLKLESRRAEIDLECYAVGEMVNGSLVLSSVKGAVSLVPSLPHLVSGADESEVTTAEEDAKMVRVQFSKVETEKSKKARQQSYSYYCQKSAEEPWYQTEYYGPESALSQVERQRLGGALHEGSTLLSSVNYLDCLVKGGDQAVHKNSGNLSQRVSDLLKRVRTIKTSVAADVLGFTEDEVLKCLQTSGVLVQGIWVLRSDLKFAGAHSAVPQEQLMRARDYVLLQFSEGRAIERSKLSEIVRLPSDILFDILSELGKLNSNKAWVFSHAPDHQFIKRYPEVVEQQGLLWDARSAQVLEGLGARRRRRDSARKNRGNSLSEDDCDTTKRSRKKSECDIKPDIATLTGIKS